MKNVDYGLEGTVEFLQEAIILKHKEQIKFSFLINLEKQSSLYTYNIRE